MKYLMLLIPILTSLLLACKQEAKESSVEEKYHGYNELANADSLEAFTISDYNTDSDTSDNIERPAHSEIIASDFDTTLLFKIWVLDPEDPHATFVLSSTSFYVADYDGDGDMPFILNKNKLTVYYNDFITTGIIKKVTSDSLSIEWDKESLPTVYTVWKD